MLTAPARTPLTRLFSTTSAAIKITGLPLPQLTDTSGTKALPAVAPLK
jgi:hypothetical protein